MNSRGALLILLGVVVVIATIFGGYYMVQRYYAVQREEMRSRAESLTPEDKMKRLEALHAEESRPATEQELEARLDVLKSLKADEVNTSDGGAPQQPRSEPSPQEIEDKLNVLKSLHGAQ